MKENTHPCPSPFLNYSVCSVVSLEPPHWSPKNNLFYVNSSPETCCRHTQTAWFPEGEKKGKGVGEGVGKKRKNPKPKFKNRKQFASWIIEGFVYM